MSQISGPGVSITFSANGQQVEAEAARVKVAVEGVGKSTSDMNAQIVQSNTAAAESWQKQVSAVTRFISKIGAAIGVATGFYALGVKIREAYDNAANAVDKASDSAEKFAQTLNFKDTEASLGKVNAEIADLQRKLGEFEQRNVIDKALRRFAGESVDAFTERIEKAEALRRHLEAKRNKEQAAAEKKADDERAAAARKREQESMARAEAMGKIMRRLDAERLDEEARINFEINEEIRETRKKFTEATTEYERRTYLAMIDALEDAREYRQRQRIEKMAKEEQRAQEEADRNRARLEQQMAADSARRQEQIAASMQAAANAMSDAARQLTEVATDVAGIRGIVETRIAIGGGRR